MNGLPDEVEPRDIADGDELVVYRIVRHTDSSAEGFIDSFKSHFELGLPPRGPAVDRPIIHRGVSVYELRDAAIETARRYPAIGGYVAELRIGPKSGITYFRWGPSGHLTLWGDPLMLSQAVVDTIPVD